MKLPNKTIITLISIPVLVLLFFSSNIYGYFRFKSYCSTEGGLRVYEKLERDMGWLAKDKYDAQVAATLDGVGFVRYKDKKDGQVYDVRYTGNNPQTESSFEVVKADESKKVRYFWGNISNFLDDDKRLKRSGYEILNVQDNHILARYYSFYYSAWGGALGGPDWQSCSNHEAKVDGWLDAFKKIFNAN